MKTLLSALLVLAAAPAALAQAPAPTSDAPLLTAAPAAQGGDDDEEEDPAPGAQTPAPEAQPAPPAQEGAVAVQPAPPNADEQKLVSGAPLYNPNVAVHIVEKKAFSDKGRFEIVAYGALQVNGKFTQHIGPSLAVLWHLHENFGFQIAGNWNPLALESDFNAELVDKVRAEAQAATSLLWLWGVYGGVEVTPFYGKFALFEGSLAHFSVVLNGGAGAGGTRHQLKPDSSGKPNGSPATYGDTGVRFLGEVGGGFRLQLGNRFAFRLEVKDIIYTARVETVNGCDADDLKAMDNVIRAGQGVTAASVRPSCRVETFDGRDPDTNLPRSTDVPLAYNLVRTPSSDVLNNLGLYLGLSVNFP